MNSFQKTTATRVLLSFAIVLLIMAGMTGLSLWRQAGAERTVTELVNARLLKQQLISEQLGAVKLDGVRTIALARSDSLDITEYFQAQLEQGGKQLAALEARIAAIPQNAREAALRKSVASAKAAYAEVRQEVLRLKSMGKTLDVEQLMATRQADTFLAYTSALEQSLAYQTSQSRALADESAAQFKASRIMLIVLGAVAIAIGIALSWMLTRSIVPPLRRAVALAQRVAEGDLQAAIEHRRKDEIGQLFDALSGMTTQLASTVGKVQQGAAAIDAASQEISAGNLDLSERTERQASALQQTAASMDELTATVKQNAESARQARELAERASDVAHKGGQVVGQVVGTMGAINDSARKIVDIISVIDGIAFQTNILALNAAVEAARAGEQGRGFAVVASEVRSLAQRSAAAAREIKTLIDNSVEKVDQGASLVDQAGQTMQEVVASVQRVSEIIVVIAGASDEQFAEIAQVNRAISHMDDATQQNAALVEEAAAASAAMCEQASQLAEVLRIFKLAPGGAATARRQPVTLSRPMMLASPARKALRDAA